MKNRITKTKETGPFLRQEFIPEKRIQRFAVEGTDPLLPAARVSRTG
ncbi:MAG: hypothetical protein M0Q93_06060 [Terrimicrobiaceae bacterium]|jgi:hypothetical protein|nr:hypothetical protein [Terrimicrobiaceae bacterium]